MQNSLRELKKINFFLINRNSHYYFVHTKACAFRSQAKELVLLPSSKEIQAKNQPGTCSGQDLML